MNPLSFAEFYFAIGGDKQDAWREYFTYGGLPLIQSFETEEKKINYPFKHLQKCKECKHHQQDYSQLSNLSV